MKQISTGAGLVALSVGMVATAFIALHRSGGEAFAQVTGGERRIVAQGVYGDNGTHWGYRIWSDNVTEVRALGNTFDLFYDLAPARRMLATNPSQTGWTSSWQAVDSGTTAFMPTDIDRSGQIDAGDIAQVLLNFNETVDQTTPPPIDCNINGLR
jgi:hypothetical protein